MLIGYARVSTQHQTLNLQNDALEKAGCQKIFTDIASGAKQERKGLEDAISHVREGDTLVVWRLDRLGRSVTHLIQTVSFKPRVRQSGPAREGGDQQDRPNRALGIESQLDLGVSGCCCGPEQPNS